MIINDVQFNASLIDILTELQSQLRLNNIPLLQKMHDSGENIQVQCPFHGNGQERRPSAGIHKETGIFHCFACEATHTLPEVISYCFGDNDMLGKSGWTWLLKNFATLKVEERNDIKLDFSRITDRNNNNNRDSNISSGGFDNLSDYRISEYGVSEIELVNYRVRHPYMYKRKLTDEVIDLFDIGYDSATNCITFPVRDRYGHCLFVARRSVETKYFNYPSNVIKPVYGIYELYKTFEDRHKVAKFDGQVITSGMYAALEQTTVIICESMLDALRCWTMRDYAVALNGLGTQRQFNTLKALPCRKFILATDNDEAGMKARKRIKHWLGNKLVTEFILPEGVKDMNDLTDEQYYNLQEVF